MACEKITTHTTPLPFNIRVEPRTASVQNLRPTEDFQPPKSHRFLITANATEVPYRARVVFDRDIDEWCL